MPAAAVIPASGANINVVAVKKLVVEFFVGVVFRDWIFFLLSRTMLAIVGQFRLSFFTVKKLECFKQVV